MREAINKKHRTLFFSPTHGWTPQETPDAQWKLRSENVSRRGVISTNELTGKDSRSGWGVSPHGEALASMSGFERGYDFTFRPRKSDSGSFVEITSTRFVDEEMTRLFLDGLVMYDEDLEKLPIPELAVEVFCLTEEHAEIFAKRITARGGQISESKADVNAMYEKLERMRTISEELQQLCAASREAIESLADTGRQNDIPEIQERCQLAHRLRTRAAKAVTWMEEEKRVADSQPGAVDRQAGAEAYLKSAGEWMAHIEQLYREHTSYEAQWRMRKQATISRNLPMVDSPSTTQRYLMIPVVEYYTDLGFDCRLVENGMIIRLEDGKVLELTNAPSIRTPDSDATAESLLGRKSAQRGAREL